MRWYALRIRCLIFSHSYALASYVANNRASPCSSSIYAVLFDGRTFEFFSFNGKTAQPTFSRGVFCLPNADLIKVLATKFYGNHTDAEFIFSLRPICETLFCFLLLAYRNGIEAEMESSVADGPNDPRGSSLSDLKEAHALACNALTLAVEAEAKPANHDETTDEQTEEALKCLQERLVLCLHLGL